MPNDWGRMALAELVGTFALVFIGAGAGALAGSSGGGIVAVALAHGLALMSMVYAVGHISGTHINPAVTVGMMATRRTGVSLGIIYIVAQLVGAAIAGLFLRVILPASAATAPAWLGATLLAPGVGFWTGVFLEGILTFFLVFTIFGAAVAEESPKQLAGVAIGLVLTFDILMGGSLTGASMNPARTFGPALATGQWSNFLAYVIGPVAGGVLAAALYTWGLLKKPAKG